MHGHFSWSHEPYADHASAVALRTRMRHHRHAFASDFFINCPFRVAVDATTLVPAGSGQNGALAVGAKYATTAGVVRNGEVFDVGQDMVVDAVNGAAAAGASRRYGRASRLATAEAKVVAAVDAARARRDVVAGVTVVVADAHAARGAGLGSGTNEFHRQAALFSTTAAAAFSSS